MVPVCNLRPLAECYEAVVRACHDHFHSRIGSLNFGLKALGDGQHYALFRGLSIPAYAPGVLSSMSRVDADRPKGEVGLLRGGSYRTQERGDTKEKE